MKPSATDLLKTSSLLRYFYFVLFLIPVNFFILPSGAGYGVQFLFFRYQETSLGTSVIPLASGLSYVTLGILTGKSALFEILPLVSAILFFVAFMYAMAGKTRGSGLILIGSGVIALLSSCILYGLTLQGTLGTCIPFGSLVFLAFGSILNLGAERSEENLLRKFDSLFLLLGVFLVFSSWATPVFMNDTLGAQMLPYQILENRTVFFDTFPEYYNDGEYAYRFTNVGNGHYATIFPIVHSVMTVPLYLIPVLVGFQNTEPVMTHLSAALIASLAVVFIYLACRFLADRKISLLSALVFAFATSTWTISSQTLYAHGFSELLLSIMIYLIFRSEYGTRSPVIFLLMGICSGLFVFNRPSDVFLIIPVLLYVLVRNRDQIIPYCAGCLAGVPFLFYNLFLFHTIFGGYAHVEDRLIFGVSTATNYLGLLIAPNKGLFIFSPVLMLAVFGLLIILRKNSLLSSFILHSLVAIALTILVYAMFDDWMGGEVYGPRYLTGILPYLAIGLCVFFTTFSQKPRKAAVLAVVAALILVSVTIQVTGLLFYEKSKNSKEYWYSEYSSYDPWDATDSVILNSLAGKDARVIDREDAGGWLREREQSKCTDPAIINHFRNDPERLALFCMGYPNTVNS